jgi:exonuclease III
VLCVQETWLAASAIQFTVPGYQVYEQRRATGTRGGLAIIVRKGLRVVQHVGNDIAQAIQVQLPGGPMQWFGNVYLPPAGALAKRGVQEVDARQMVEATWASIPQSQGQFLCGDFNARIGNSAPDIEGIQLERHCVD